MPALTYRTTGGILDFYILTGPSPDSVVEQYTGLVGRSFMPPYWALGFHLCRWGYGSSEEVKTVIKRMRDAKMPYVSKYASAHVTTHHPRHPTPFFPFSQQLSLYLYDAKDKFSYFCSQWKSRPD